MMASHNTFCLTALVFLITYLTIAASKPTGKVSTSDNRLLNKGETWVVEGEKQDEIFPKDEGFEEIVGPEPTASRKKRDINAFRSYDRLLTNGETWVVEEKEQNEVFPKDEEFEVIIGPEPTAARKKREAGDERIILDIWDSHQSFGAGGTQSSAVLQTPTARLGRGANPSIESTQYVYDEGF